MVNALNRPSQVVRPGDTVDRFVIEAKLGEGGAAVVFRVRHRELGTLHALKILRILAGDQTERLIREGRIQATLKHPNIVGVTDVVRVGSFPALIMEHVAGLSLGELLSGYRPEAAEIDALARDILAGMRSAHDHGLVHRDLKPGNVLLALGPDGIVAKIGDFGVARVLDELRGRRSTRPGQPMGTPAFMAPEQLRSARDADHRADIFALGALLYELVSGVPAFDDEGGDDLIAIYLATSTGAYRPLDEVAPGAPQRWVDAIHAALRPDPAERPQTVAELTDRWVAGSDPPWPNWNLALIAGLADTTPSSRDSLVWPHPVTATIIPPPARPFSASIAPLVFAATAIGVMFAGSVLLSIAAVWWMGREEPPPIEVLEVITVDHPVRIEPVPTVEAPPPVVSHPPVALSPPPPPIALPRPHVPVPRTTLEVAGIERAWLEDPRGHRVRPGAVAPGAYVLHVFFDAAKPTRVMSFTLADGERRLVRCDPLTRICK